jgi:hypothetical protein
MLVKQKIASTTERNQTSGVMFGFGDSIKFGFGFQLPNPN